jgi:hypothetical protein
MATAALVLGIIAVVLSLFGPGGWIGSVCGVLAIILGAIAMKNDDGKKKLAKAGLILGIVALTLGIIVTIACIACIGAGAAAVDWDEVLNSIQ